MASGVIPSLPIGQQQPGAGEIDQETNPVGAGVGQSHSSSGSVGPFFGVISVLALLSILSCILGRICSRRAAAGRSACVTPHDTVSGDGSCLGWMRRRCQWCMSGGDVEAATRARKKVTTFIDIDPCKGKEIDPEVENPPQA